MVYLSKSMWNLGPQQLKALHLHYHIAQTPTDKVTWPFYHVVLRKNEKHISKLKTSPPPECLRSPDLVGWWLTLRGSLTRSCDKLKPLTGSYQGFIQNKLHLVDWYGHPKNCPKKPKVRLCKLTCLLLKKDLLNFLTSLY